MGFFDDIFIPAESLQKNSRFDETEHTWVWEYESEEGKHDLFMDTGLKKNSKHDFTIIVMFNFLL